MGVVIEDTLTQRQKIQTGALPNLMVFYDQLPADTDRGVRAANGSLGVIVNRSTGNAFLSIKAQGAWYDVQTDLPIDMP